jgi:hypothetical protein
MSLLQELAGRLVIPGLPAWTGLLALLLLMLAALAFLLMPFAVFGVKGRLEAIEAQLDELQAEIRALSLRLSTEGQRRAAAIAADDWVEPPALRRGTAGYGAETTPRAEPPVPPPAAWPQRRASRAEPRLDWPDRTG